MCSVILKNFANLCNQNKLQKSAKKIQSFLTARLRRSGLRNGLFVVVVVLGKLFPIPRKKWIYDALLTEQRVHEISGLQTLSTKSVDFKFCPRNKWTSELVHEISGN